MARFFGKFDSVADPLYLKVKQASTPPLVEARAFVEEMWASCEQFLESNSARRAASEFYPVWWELYLAYSLHNAGITLVPTTDHPRQGKGHPDLLAEFPRVWIEGVMPRPGDGPDAVVGAPLGKVYTVPTDAQLLRLRAAIEEKARKFRRYVEDGTVSSADATLIAVSGARLPYRFNELPIPGVVRAVLGTGNLTLEIDPARRKIVGSFLEHQDHVVKKSGSPVTTDIFLQKEFAYISGVLYSPSDCVNHPKRPGEELILVHNRNADVRLPGSWLLVGDQYWVEGGALCRKRAGNKCHALRVWRKLYRLAIKIMRYSWTPWTAVI